MLHKNYSTINQPPRTTMTFFDRQNKSTLDMYRTTKLSSLTHDRPNTSFLLVHRLNTASHQREVSFSDKQQIDSAEQDLQAIYQLDLNKYLHKKFRNFLVRKHENNPAKPTVVTIQNPETLENFCSKMEVSLILDQERRSQSKPKTLRPKRAIQTAYLLNAKERIARLVELKRQKQAYFSTLKLNIKERVKRKQKAFAAIGPLQLSTIEDKQISERIKVQFEHQIQRYKQRISSKLRIKSLKKHQSNIFNE